MIKAVAETPKPKRTERERVGSILADRRRGERDIRIDAVVNQARKNRCKKDIYKFLSTYFPDNFSNPFTDDQREMINAILHMARHGGDQAIAAPRGEGKTTITERVAIYCLLFGVVKFLVIVAATGPDASRILANIKHEIECNDRLKEDFPEVCDPVRALDGAIQRARMQTVAGVRTMMEWSADIAVFPTVGKSPASGAVLMTRGLDAAIRGINYHGRRPDMVIVDDPETRESAASEYQCGIREQTLDRDIAGLGGPGKKIARLMLCTIQNRRCLAFKFTDPKQKPSWGGKRYALLVQKPDRLDLWDEYVHMRQAGQETGSDPDGIEATKFYADRRIEMDAGAVLSNVSRYIKDTYKDGTPVELSALQHCYNQIAKIGWDSFSTEYQNDPPEELGEVESGITPHRVQKQVNGYERRVVPPGCVKLTRGIDCGKALLHWVVRAWMPNGTGYTIDYGRHEVAGTVYGSDEGIDVALKKAILAFLDESKDYGYCLLNGEVLEIDRTLIDARWRTQAVYDACVEAGFGVQPVMGIGQSDGCVQANFNDVQRRTTDKRPGDGWFMSRKGKLWLVLADADRWKAWEHDRWMTAPDKPGCMSVFGAPSAQGERFSHDEREHHSYARHICNEIEIEEPYKGTTRRRWKPKGANHWLDASYYSNVAANMEGIRLPGPSASRLADKKSGPAPTAAELAKLAGTR